MEWQWGNPLDSLLAIIFMISLGEKVLTKISIYVIGNVMLIILKRMLFLKGLILFQKNQILIILILNSSMNQNKIIKLPSLMSLLTELTSVKQKQETRVYRKNQTLSFTFELVFTCIIAVENWNITTSHHQRKKHQLNRRSFKPRNQTFKNCFLQH